MSVLFCDSNCELWFERQEALGIRFISMPYAVNGEERFYDLGKETDFKAFFNKMRAGERVTTSALNAQDYLNYFEPVLEAGEDVLYLTFSHKLSATFSQMDAAIDELKKKYPERKILTYDTRSISIGTGELVYVAAKLHREGVPDEEILERLDALRKREAVYFTPETLVYLARGGRLGKGAAAMGNLLNIKPMLTISPDGALENYAKVNGRKKALRHLADKVKELGIDTDYPIQIVNADAPEDGRLLVDIVREAVGEHTEIWTQPVGPVIGCHCGPGTIGICWISKKDLY